MVQVSRWHNFSPAMKNHRAPQGLKEKEEEGKKRRKKKASPVKAGLGTFFSASIETISPAD